jgi:signal transduction histidine kinase
VSTTFVVYSVQIAPGGFSVREPLCVNRVLASAAVLITACLLHAWINAVDVLDAQGHMLREQNDDLDAANQELSRRGELIAKQNDELDRRRREAEDASTRKTQMLRSVSHDIRSPLHAINIMADVIRRAASDPALIAEVPHLTQRLQANAASLNEFVTNVLDISAFESGRMSMHETEFSLPELLRQDASQLLPLAQAKGLKFTVEAPVETRLMTDRSKLLRVLTNLLSNAIKFTDEGEVTLSAFRTHHGVDISVRDTGVGISDQDIKQVFEEFARVQTAPQEREKGWGLGLAISRRLVDMMGGTITAESAPSVGTTFTVHLPMSCVLIQ